MSYNEVPNRIAEKYSKMTKSEKRIADYFLEQKRDLQLTSITELAEQCSVADSTIFRFCKMLGYNGYNDFKIAIAKEQGRVQGTSDAEGKEFDIYSSITTEVDLPTTGQKLAAMYSAALEQMAGITQAYKCRNGSPYFAAVGTSVLFWSGRKLNYGYGSMGTFQCGSQTF